MAKYKYLKIIISLTVVVFLLSGCFMPFGSSRGGGENHRGYGDDPFEEVRYDARYFFEQSLLLKNARDYEKEMIESIKDSDRDIIESSVRISWDQAAGNTLYNTLSSAEKKRADQGRDEYFEIINQKRLEYDLGDDHIVDVSIEKLGDDRSAVIVKMLEQDWFLLCTYIGITYDQNEKIRYFTLERSYDDEDFDGRIYMFCFINGPGVRGSIDLVDNDKEAFVKAMANEF